MFLPLLSAAEMCEKIFTNYFRRLIPNCADKAHGLSKLLSKDSLFKWVIEQETSFRALEDASCNPPVMALRDPTQEMILTTDASDKPIPFVSDN